MVLPLSIVIIVLIVLSAFFSCTETAFSCANKIKLKSMVLLGKRNAKAVLKFADENYNKLVTTILIGNNIVNLTASALGTILFAEILKGTGVDHTTISTAVLTVLVLLFGEITPKYFASTYPEKFCFFVYPLMQLFYWIFFPLGFVFDAYKAGLSKLFKMKKDDTVTDEELLSLVDEAEESGTLKEDESELVRSALEFDDLKVEDILVPRVDVFAVEKEMTMDEVRAVFEKTGYSRLPVYKGTIDNVIGLIHERDFYMAYVRGGTKLADLVQDVAFTSEHTRISTLLKQLQKKKVHLAVVSDEYGGLVGIVTLEDILEQLVGEIWDEHDEEEVLFGKIDDGEYWVDGKCGLKECFELYDLEDEAEKFDSNTVGGWVTEVYGEIPPVGEVIACKHLEIRVVKVNRQKVLKVRTKRADDYDEAEYDEKSKSKDKDKDKDK